LVARDEVAAEMQKIEEKLQVSVGVVALAAQRRL
jgi:hypothetical protein